MALKIGDPIPEFLGINQHGKEILAKQFKGNKLVIYFYPKDSTPGCTAQACNLRDNYNLLLDAGYQILGVSADSQKRHQNFIEKQNLPFDLIADEELTLIKAFGVWGPKKFMGKEYEGIHRTTFVINENGSIEDVISKVKTKEHTAQILN